MPKGDKFVALTVYLDKCNKDIVKMSFSDVEKILGFKLSNSAYVHQAYCSNTQSHSFAFGWLNAGYKTQNVDIKKQAVEFISNDI
ncbi:MAG: hypothetical protein PUE08_05035 [Eubacteriales bacterium]|nr:hypothetical protein [Eubacteriales bacterium]